MLGSREGMTACSTAAGPALEGANISCGMGGTDGAINNVSAAEENGREVFSFSVIGDVEPVGICGSGIIDAAAVFIRAGVIDYTGRILSKQELTEAGVHSGWIDCLCESGGFPALRIADNILLTQQDIREIQTAKGAVAAGIKTLLHEAGKTAADVKKLYIAGGFGAAINKSSAAAIGLFPPELEAVAETAGNTAGKGAVLAALSESEMKKMKEAAEAVEYIELSASAFFQMEYMNEMFFHG